MRHTFCNHQKHILPSDFVSSDQMQQTFPFHHLELGPVSLHGAEIVIFLATWSKTIIKTEASEPKERKEISEVYMTHYLIH